jgi:hypothetical protein
LLRKGRETRDFAPFMRIAKCYLFACFKWQSKLWFTISIEDYTKWTIKASRRRTTTAEVLSLHEQIQRFMKSLKSETIFKQCDIFFCCCLHNNHLFKTWKMKIVFLWGTAARKRGFVSLKHGRGTKRAQLNILCMKNQLHYHICSKFHPFVYESKDVFVPHMPRNVQQAKFVFMENWANIWLQNRKF